MAKEQEMERSYEDNIEVLFDEDTVDARIRELGRQISSEYQGKTIHMICVLKGGAYFMTELSKRITVSVTLDFMCVSSYGSGTVSSGNIKIKKDLDESVEGRDVLVVEDIVDTGRTLSCLLMLLKERGASSVKLCTLLNKPDRRELPVEIDYNGFTIPDAFVVGCGLDYDQKYRNLPYIGVVKL